jgi:hypothetical protein
MVGWFKRKFAEASGKAVVAGFTALITACAAAVWAYGGRDLALSSLDWSIHGLQDLQAKVGKPTSDTTAATPTPSSTKTDASQAPPPIPPQQTPSSVPKSKLGDNSTKSSPMVAKTGATDPDTEDLIFTYKMYDRSCSAAPQDRFGIVLFPIEVFLPEERQKIARYAVAKGDNGVLLTTRELFSRARSDEASFHGLRILKGIYSVRLIDEDAGLFLYGGFLMDNLSGVRQSTLATEKSNYQLLVKAPGDSDFAPISTITFTKGCHTLFLVFP